jgi:PKD repeat protein
MVFLFISQCKKSAYLAPTGSKLLVAVNPAVIALGGETTVEVIGYKNSGSLLPDGTVIYFSVDFGSIDATAETKDGRARSIFRSTDNRSGKVTVTVSSGDAEVTPELIQITVGSSALHNLKMRAEPPVLPRNGGSSNIVVTTQDENLNPIADIPVTLTTTAGQLANNGALLYTGSNGEASTILTTTTDAVLTASSGDITIELEIKVESNEAPDAQFVYSPETPKVGERVYFNAQNSTDPEGEITAYNWDFGDGKSDSGVMVEHKYKKIGTYTVVLSVVDGVGNTDTTSKVVNVSTGDGPSASFEYSPRNPSVNQDIHFNAELSTDADGDIVSYQWDMGDGNKKSGKTVDHRYADDGSYAVVLVVTDNDGNTDSTSQIIAVGGSQGPNPAFVYSPPSPTVGQDIFFNAQTTTDPDDDITGYSWDFGDGKNGTGVTVIHNYSETGTYKVTLTVTDSTGNSASITDTVTVSASKPPVAVFEVSPITIYDGDTVFFNASQSTDPDGNDTIQSYVWDYGDGNSGNGQTSTHVYQTPNRYKVILEITDEDGNTSTTSKEINVLDGAPSANITYSPTAPNASQTVTFSATGSTDPNGYIVSWQWDFGDNATGSGERATHQYAAAGTYIVTLTVVDDSGRQAKATATITVY